MHLHTTASSFTAKTGKEHMSVERLRFKLPSGIAKQFGVSVSAVRKAISEGRLPYYTVSGATRNTYLIDPNDAAELWDGGDSDAAD